MTLKELKVASTLLLISLATSLALFCPNDAFAAKLFSDDFSGDLSKWEYSDEYGTDSNSWTIINEELKGEVGRSGTSILRPIGFSHENSKYVFEADVKNVVGVDQEFYFNVSEDRTRFYQLDVRYNDPLWPQDHNNLTLHKRKDGNWYLLTKIQGEAIAPGFTFTQNIWHHLKVIVSGSTFNVYFDDRLILDFTDDNEPYLKGSFALKNWAGDYGTTINYFDNVIVSTGGQSVESNKVILLPGLGASWNSEAMVYNQQVDPGEWQMTPFVNNYKGLIEALEEEGLVKDEDFWVWNYDWRQPVEDIASQLDDFIGEKVGESEKVDLVGHSLGGLTARVWLQEGENKDKANKAITLGSPHQGSVSAYEAWSGGRVSDKFDPAKAALKILALIHEGDKGGEVGAIRAYAPILKDLMPTFSFLKEDGIQIALTDMESQNNWLLGQNEEIAAVFDSLEAIAASGEETKRWINVGQRSVFDRIRGVWPDGKPLSYDFDIGDGTVLKMSATVTGDDYIEITSNHGDMVADGVSEVMAELGYAEVADVEATSGGNLVFFVGSPATMEVSCDNGQTGTNDSLGFVVLDGDEGSCRIVLTGVTSGRYYLVVGNLNDEDAWQYFEGEINEGEAKQLEVNVDGSVRLTEDNLDYLYQAVEDDLDKLLTEEPRNPWLMLAKMGVKSRRVEKIIRGVGLYRKMRQEMAVTSRIWDNCMRITAIENKNIGMGVALRALKAAENEKRVIDGLTEIRTRQGKGPSLFGANSYEQMVELLTGAKQALTEDSAPWVMAKSIMAEKYGQEVW